jgi:hypothetical protein
MSALLPSRFLVIAEEELKMLDSDGEEKNSDTSIRKSVHSWVAKSKAPIDHVHSSVTIHDVLTLRHRKPPNPNYNFSGSKFKGNPSDPN